MQKYAVPLTALAALATASCARASADEGTYVDAGVRTTSALATMAREPIPGPIPAAVAPAPSAQPVAACPEGMLLVDGDYCPDVEQRCLEWMDPPGSTYEHFRCKRYAQPATCHGKRVHKRFCIDAIERTEDGSDLPRNRMSWTASTALCEAAGARLCKTSEWQFACEGEEMRPYPYGWERDATACNVDVMTGLGKVGGLVDHRTPASAHPRCVSPFGVHDMAGNVDEWATVDGLPRGKREVMKGSWWLPGRHACRSGQGGHGASYGGTESGARCCADAAPDTESSQSASR
ncbi:MAG: formylglycine-generating enzyme family protein [Polyangiaceae bacterium]|jgi:formylglycine-generating enzyme